MKGLKKLIALWVLCILSFSVGAEPVTTILDSGAPENRVDIVVLGDGYTSSEMQKYANDVQIFINGFFAGAPFNDYKTYFNVHIINVISNESGSDHPENNSYKDTALDSYYNCANIQRLICVDTTKVNNIINNSVSPTQRDIKLILINDSTYGGSGGAVAVASTHSFSSELVLHEVGHSFGLLADEYDYGSSSCNSAQPEPPEVNVTTETNRALIKWNKNDTVSTGWIETSTAIPTTVTTPSLVGLYEGARYCPNGIYRPTYDSKMRSLNKPFEQVNEEQLVKRIYNFVSPLDSISPTQTSITLNKGITSTFQVNTLVPVLHNLSINWKLDGITVGTNSQYELNTSLLNTGSHMLTYEITDTTPKVRNDPASVLKESGQWQITINAIANDNDNDGIPDDIDPDDDNDGMPDTFEIQYGFDPLDDADAQQDADGDGFTNLQEFQMGTNPLQQNTMLDFMVPVIELILDGEE